MCAKQQQTLLPTRAAHGRLHRNRDAVAWPFSTLCRVSGPTLFQMTFTAALWVAVFGKCGPPPAIPNALPASDVNRTDFESHTTLKYECLPGYGRGISRMMVYCKPSGEWEISVSCAKKHCRNPGYLDNGYVNGETITFGSQIEFSCQEGFILVGSSTSSCEVRGKGVAWSNPFPECVIVKCGPPPDISNGKHSGTEDFYPYNHGISYTCDPGFRLVGSPFIGCTVVNKTVPVWSSSPPTCEKIICSQPNILHGVIVSGYKATYTHRDSVRLACLNGTVLRGRHVIECQALCQKPEVGNGTLSDEKDQYVESENVTIQCDSGFAMLGSQSISCSESGTWYPEVPRCEQEASEDLKPALTGNKTMQYVPNSHDVKMALEIYKLTLEVELLQLQIQKEKHTEAH
ncbi:C4b-binding protein isoform 4 [Mus musculus]|uniref:C4b-binding protein isoform 4 n=1 Tax=Mus musculus TaxID=10090 RepID=UPI00244E35A1|nr:C4b-binding protein isoform 4 [Mus musculus]